MSMVCIPLEYKDYDLILTPWWNSWGWITPPSRDILPENGVGGMIVFDGETPVCAGYIYDTNSKICWINWVVSNKHYRKKPNRSQAFSMLIKNLEREAFVRGYKACYFASNSRVLNGRLEKEGFLKGSSTQEMIKSWD